MLLHIIILIRKRILIWKSGRFANCFYPKQWNHLFLCFLQWTPCTAKVLTLQFPGTTLLHFAPSWDVTNRRKSAHSHETPHQDTSATISWRSLAPSCTLLSADSGFLRGEVEAGASGRAFKSCVTENVAKTRQEKSFFFFLVGTVYPTISLL